jgi:hypothetical protein
MRVAADSLPLKRMAIACQDEIPAITVAAASDRARIFREYMNRGQNTMLNAIGHQGWDDVVQFGDEW